MAGVEDYEWDETKRARNLRKHGLDFASAARFDWITARLIRDDGHDEARMIAIGYTGPVLVVMAYVERGECTRIISLRRATPRERRRYEQAQTYRNRR